MAGVMRSYRAIAGLTAAISAWSRSRSPGCPSFTWAMRGPLCGWRWRPRTLIALFAAFLVFGRLRRRTYLNELLLACALAVLALSSLLFVAVPTVAGEAPTT